MGKLSLFVLRSMNTNTLCGQNVEFFNVKLVVPVVTTGLLTVKSLL